MNAGRESISIVVPVLNELGLVAPFLQELRARALGAEIVVADGGSTDGTLEAARKIADRVVSSPRGRGRQLNAGAAAAAGELLWFLHVDSHIPAGSLDEIRRMLADPKCAGGYFRIRLPRRSLAYRLTDTFAHYAGFILRIRCGDHGFFCRREGYLAAGKFPQVPLMEDVEFYRALRRLGSVRASQLRLAVDTRRYERLGKWKLTMSYGLIALLYALGVPISRLTKIYKATCQPRAWRDSNPQPSDPKSEALSS